ncbi:MAG: flavodoxin family protein [Methanotrichaceae archaeon]|nr:flavodoxin family protein [Methanotrichaceae archaeon]
MNVLALNGSPHMDDGNTAMILRPFLEGMKEAGANVDLFYTKKLTIGPCNGDMSCWFKNPGKCGQDDDMQMLLPKFKEADVIVWASPVYYAGITGPLKNLMDRQLPLHMSGELANKRQKIVLVSSCGFWDMSMFDPLLAQMKAISTRPDGSSDFAGALLRPGAEPMREMMKGEGRAILESIFKAAKEAGRQLVIEGKISKRLLDDVSKRLMSEEEYKKGANEMMEQIKKSMAK